MGIVSNIRNVFSSEKRAIQGISGTPINYTDYQTLWNSWFGGFENKAKVNVTPNSSLTLSPFYSSVRNISEDISKLPFKVLVNKTDGNRYPLYRHPAYLLLSIKPNDFSTPFTIKETLIQSALIRGNGYAYIERDSNAAPIALYWLRNECVNPILKDRKLYYIVSDPEAMVEGTFTSDDIFHLRGMGTGYLGVSVISYASESIGKAIATQQFGASFFGSTGMKGILKFLNAKDEAKMKQAKEAFQRTYEEDGLAAVNQSMEFEKIQVPNNDAQFIESQDFNVADIARWFRMPLSKLQKDSNTGGEQEAIQYVNDCLYPWVKRLEEEIEAKLFKENEKFVLDASFSFDALLKGDSAAQERRIKTMFMTGSWSQNDIRKFMDYNTLPEGGDETYLPVNMIPSKLAQDFWAAKKGADNQATTASPDSSGSGNVNANINNRSKSLDKIEMANSLIEQINLDI